MVKHTQTIPRQITDELFDCVWPFCEMALNELETNFGDDPNVEKVALRPSCLQ